MVRSSFLNIGITFATFKSSGKLPVEKDKFAISDIGLPRAVWNNFKDLQGFLEGPEDLLLLDSYINGSASAQFLGDTKNELVYGFFRYL